MSRKKIFKIVLVVLFFLIILIAGFLLLNSYIYNEKQADSTNRVETVKNLVQEPASSKSFFV